LRYTSDKLRIVCRRLCSSNHFVYTIIGLFFPLFVLNAKLTKKIWKAILILKRSFLRQDWNLCRCSGCLLTRCNICIPELATAFRLIRGGHKIPLGKNFPKKKEYSHRQLNFSNKKGGTAKQFQNKKVQLELDISFTQFRKFTKQKQRKDSKRLAKKNSGNLEANYKTSIEMEFNIQMTTLKDLQRRWYKINFKFITIFSLSWPPLPLIINLDLLPFMYNTGMPYQVLHTSCRLPKKMELPQWGEGAEYTTGISELLY
jgi:hypothetical protein